MPVYEYEHLGPGCGKGKRFEFIQRILSAKLTVCPDCGTEVRRLISLVAISTPTTDSKLKSHGFTKLVRRDKGVYENVTAVGKEGRIWDAAQPDTMPNLRGKIGD